jgi:transcription initiation factor IIF auxiliary subunit
MTPELFQNLCRKKAERIAKRNELYVITNLNVSNFDREKINAHQVIFGKKYIYLLSNFMLKGFVSGDEKDNSWVYFDNVKRKNNYLTNLHALSNKNIQDFEGISQISADSIVSICVVPNEVDFKIEHVKNENTLIVHYSSLNRVIKRLESKQIGEFDKEQIVEKFKLINSKNGERN